MQLSRKLRAPVCFQRFRNFAQQATAAEDAAGLPRERVVTRAPLGHLARRKEEDKQFFADLLSSAATRRDAKAYINRLKTDRSRTQTKPIQIFSHSAAVTASPVFEQNTSDRVEDGQNPVLPHIALVKISSASQISDDVLEGIAGTLTQLARLSMLPCIVTDEPIEHDPLRQRRQTAIQIDRLMNLLDGMTDTGARKVGDLLEIGTDGRPFLSVPSLLEKPLQRAQVTVVVPTAFDGSTQSLVNVSADDVMVALTKYMTGATPHPSTASGSQLDLLSQAAVVDRLIVIDKAGGVPSTKSVVKMHVFVNMEQEYHALQEELRSSTDHRVSRSHASTLSMLRQCLQLLPSTASGLMTTPSEAANSNQVFSGSSSLVSSVGTRRQRNPLIHNLLTDKPAYSASLPASRMTTGSPILTTSTSVKHGLPLTILPNPAAQEWTPDKRPWIKLTDPRIDLDRLVYLINDSFGRQLDVAAYLRRVNDSIAGVIIAGDYEGGAILTWERPPHLPTDTNRLVPYLDKFAVLQKSQGGGGGVADILFNAMTRTCFPHGVCWRSRKKNPVNKWYFERSLGTWKIPDMDWTMFWTTPDVIGSTHRNEVNSMENPEDQTFLDYEAVCRNVQPTWLDAKGKG